MDAAIRVDPGNRAASGADFDNIDHGKLHRLAASGPADDIAFLDGRNNRW
jgi:hypothetical protein